MIKYYNFFHHIKVSKQIEIYLHVWNEINFDINILSDVIVLGIIEIYLRDNSANVCSSRWSKLGSNRNGCKHLWHEKLTLLFISTIVINSLIHGIISLFFLSPHW